jgi:hypothetical protein
MHYKKLLWGAVVSFGFFGAAFLWYSFSPVTAKNFVAGAGGAATQTWSEIVSGGVAQNKQSEIVIDDNSSDTIQENIASVATATNTPSELEKSTPDDLSAVVDGGDDVSLAPSTSSPSSAMSSDQDPSSDQEVVVAPIITTASSSPLPTTPSCSFSFPSASVVAPAAIPPLSRQIIFNEIAWMGSPGASTGEWMEIKNVSGSDVDLSGWELLNASGKIKILFATGDDISAGGLMLLARTNTTFSTGVAPQKTYSGDLRNAGDDLALIDASCGVSDFLAASSAGWPAGNNTTKQTMERDADGIGWHTSVSPGGTPGKENGVPPPPVLYKVSISFEGSGSATVASSPSGMTCVAECVGNYASGTKITLSVIPAASTAFVGWSGTCYGQTKCALTLAGDVDVTAQIRSTLALPIVTDSGDTDVVNTTDMASSTLDTADINVSTTTSSTTADSTPAPVVSSEAPSVPSTHPLIAAIQIAGAAASDDLVKIYNPTTAPVDMSGWKLHKKSSSGADYSIREFPANTTIAPQHYFVWANSADGFAASVGADISSTQTLAADNSIALIDTSGAIVDAVAWGTGTGQYGEGPPFPTDPGPGQTLVRRTSGGAMVDTENNANDFMLQ